MNSSTGKWRMDLSKWICQEMRGAGYFVSANKWYELRSSCSCSTGLSIAEYFRDGAGTIKGIYIAFVDISIFRFTSRF
jgi:hypothetical protein